MATGELKTRKTGASVDDFIDTLDDEQMRDDCRALIKLMSAATNDGPAMWGPAIIGFGHGKLKYPNGREIDWMQIAFSPRKANLTRYLDGDHTSRAAQLKKLGKHSISKACLYIKRLADVDMKVLKEMIEASVRAEQKK